MKTITKQLDNIQENAILIDKIVQKVTDLFGPSPHTLTIHRAVGNILREVCIIDKVDRENLREAIETQRENFADVILGAMEIASRTIEERESSHAVGKGVEHESQD